jgi:hypothetical protein
VLDWYRLKCLALPLTLRPLVATPNNLIGLWLIHRLVTYVDIAVIFVTWGWGAAAVAFVVYWIVSESGDRHAERYAQAIIAELRRRAQRLP